MVFFISCLLVFFLCDHLHQFKPLLIRQMGEVGTEKVLDLLEGDLLFVAGQILDGNVQRVRDAHEHVHAGLPVPVHVS
ncbi:MAG: hypothetical protein J6Z38_06940 [Lachnospiraceae bacterium]|nr:hypothetical protein [Lachnospiraceae bacterium]